VTFALPAEVVEAIARRAAAIVLDRQAATVEAAASPFVTVGEAAELLRTTRGRIDNLLSAGRLTRVKDGRRTLILLAEIDAYLRRDDRRRPL
jgi:excisionase family DNA binding protein